MLFIAKATAGFWKTISQKNTAKQAIEFVILETVAGQRVKTKLGIYKRPRDTTR